MQIPWLFPIFIFSLTFNKIPWLFPDFCQVWNFPDFSLTAGHPAIVLTSFIDIVFVLSTSLPVAWITNGLQPDEKHGIELLIFNGYWTATAEMPTFLTSPQLGRAHHRLIYTWRKKILPCTEVIFEVILEILLFSKYWLWKYKVEVMVKVTQGMHHTVDLNQSDHTCIPEYSYFKILTWKS